MLNAELQKSGTFANRGFDYELSAFRIQHSELRIAFSPECFASGNFHPIKKIACGKALPAFQLDLLRLQEQAIAANHAQRATIGDQSPGWGSQRLSRHGAE